jgi:predicted DNA-binding transcriptional regulator YafY
MEKTLHIGHRPYRQSGESGETFALVNDAVSSRHKIEIDYHTMSRNNTMTRIVEPYSIWFSDGSFYVIAFCTTREDIRLFALDRITGIRLLDETFNIPADYNPEDFMKSSFGVFKGKVTHVRIRFSPDAAGYIREKTWHETQVLTDQDDGSLIFSADVEGTDEIRFWVMSWGSKAEVLEPESLRQEILIETQTMLDMYHQSHSLLK